LRNVADVTVIEQGRGHQPLFDDIRCDQGGVTTTINRASGLGGTTNYWHNALIEMAADDLRGCGIDPAQFEPHYRRAWSLFLSDAEQEACRAIERAMATEVVGEGSAYMVAPQNRVNVWDLAAKAWPGNAVNVVHGRAQRVTVDGRGTAQQLVVETPNGAVNVAADHFILAAGGLATPEILAASFRSGETLCGGYHDHPMTYLAKLRLRPDSPLQRISCVVTGSASVRAGFVYEARGLKTVFYLRPALSLNTRTISGEARFILSDLRNDPFSPRKLLQLFRNVEALREAVLFKARAGFVGEYYSVMMFGEQEPLETRGVRHIPGAVPVLNWHVTATEHLAYRECLEQFLAEISGDLVDRNVIPVDEWQFRTGAHHSGTARDFMSSAPADGLGFFAAADAGNVSVCDGSVLRRGGVANTGLTLVGLANQLADLLGGR
jgi:hypothetical protein